MSVFFSGKETNDLLIYIAIARVAPIWSLLGGRDIHHFILGIIHCIVPSTPFKNATRPTAPGSGIP